MTNAHPALMALAWSVCQIGCAGRPPPDSYTAKLVPVGVDIVVTGSDGMCNAHIYSEEHGCVYAWGTEVPVDGAILNSDGCVRVACGELGEVCGVVIFCKCRKGQPRSSRECSYLGK